MDGQTDGWADKGTYRSSDPKLKNPITGDGYVSLSYHLNFALCKYFLCIICDFSDQPKNISDFGWY